MEPRYFSDALGDLSETLRPHVQEGVSEELRELVEMLKEEYPNLWIDRYTILDANAKPHAVAFDFEIDIILYLHVNGHFDSPECVKEINDIVITWDVTDFENIDGGFQFVYQGITVNLLLARNMTTVEDGTMCDGGIGEEMNKSLVISQCQSVISHIEGQTSGMTDASDKTYIMENLGKRYSSSLLESYHYFYSSQTPFCLSFVRICKFWCLKVFLNGINFGILKYAEALAIYVCSRKESANDYLIIFVDFLHALRKYSSIQIDFNFYSSQKNPEFTVPYITDVTFPYSNILKEIRHRDFETLRDAADDTLKAMKTSRSFGALFGTSPYHSNVIEKLEPFYFIFQPSETMSIEISVQSNKKDILPLNFLPELSSRLYLWRQCAIADTRRHQDRECGSFYRAVSGMVVFEFMKALEATEVGVPDHALASAPHKIVINFPDYSHEDQVFRCGTHRSRFFTLLCGSSSKKRKPTIESADEGIETGSSRHGTFSDIT